MLGAVGIEAGDDGRELVDGAAEALAVLLDELGHLRQRQAAEQRDEERDAAEDHGPVSGRGRRPA